MIIFLLKEDAMKRAKFKWNAFLSVFASIILAFFLVSCNGGGEPPTGEQPETPAMEGTESEHPEHPE